MKQLTRKSLIYNKDHFHNTNWISLCLKQHYTIYELTIAVLSVLLFCSQSFVLFLSPLAPEYKFNCSLLYTLNWERETPPVSITCVGKKQPRFYWRCSSVVMKGATPLTLPSAWTEIHALDIVCHNIYNTTFSHNGLSCSLTLHSLIIK